MKGRYKSFAAFSVTFVILVAAALLFCGQLISSAGSAGGSDAALPQNTNPIATIKSILVNGAEQLQAGPADLRVSRAGGAEEGGQPGTFLYAGDDVSTGPATQITLLYLDDATEKDNEVLVDANSKVRIGSIFDWVGKILVTVKGAFETRTEKAKLGVQGTEFEVLVQPDGTNRITVLDGNVTVEKDNSPPPTATLDRAKVPDPRFSFAQVIKASYEQPPLHQNEKEFVAVSGQSISLEDTFTFANRCRQRHQFEIHTPANLGWFNLLGADRFVIEGGQSRSITFALRIDAQQIPAGIYRGEIIARCMDCDQEQSCDLSGLLLPIRIRVGVKGGGGGTSTTGTGESKVSANKRQQVTLAQGVLSGPTTAPPERLMDSINWSNDVLVGGQPSYTAQHVVPHFTSSVRRDTFRQARQNAILHNDSASYKAMGDAYADWGNGAKAVDSYNRAGGQIGQQTPQFLTDLAEAYRQRGDLDNAEQFAGRALSLDRTWAPALNVLGNVYLDRAQVAEDKRNDGLAQSFLERAKASYTQALSGRSTAASGLHHTQSGATGNPQTVAQSNLGEVYLRLGSIARGQGRIEEALGQYQAAEKAFGNANKIDQSYQFAVTGLADVYREAGEMSLSVGDQGRASQFFSRSQQLYGQAVKLHRDMAEGYVGLGRVLEDTGHPRDAVNQYSQATRVRPDLPEPHYFLAAALVNIDPRKAAEEARAYLKLERPPLKQGERANNAQRIENGLPPISPTPTPTPTPTRTSPPTPTPTPEYNPSPGPEQIVKVPGTKGDKPDEAVNKLRKQGLVGQIKNQPDCDASNRVLYSEPAKDQRVPAGTIVVLYVSSVGDNPARVPKVTDLSAGNAERQLRSAGLLMKVTKRQESELEPNTVLRQNPDAYKQIMSGCAVEVTVSIPVPLVTVPQYIGLNINQVFRGLGRVLGDLVRGNVVEVDGRQSPGTIVDQDPKPGEMVRRGTAVNLVVIRSGYSESTVTVPNLVGKKFGDAKIILSRLGLGWDLDDYSPTDTSIISQQDPPRGTKVARGKKIRLSFASNNPGF